MEHYFKNVYLLSSNLSLFVWGIVLKYMLTVDIIWHRYNRTLKMYNGLVFIKLTIKYFKEMIMIKVSYSMNDIGSM